MEQIKNIPLPIAIVIGCVVLGSFYYAVEAKKQDTVLEQQRIEREAKDLAESSVAFKKRLCATEASESAIDLYKQLCTYDCKEGVYYVANYDNSYKACLQREGVE